MLEDEALWQEFAAESEEHLDTIERLLAAPRDRGAVDGLFRPFHSLKGMSAALGGFRGRRARGPGARPRPRPGRRAARSPRRRRWGRRRAAAARRPAAPD